MFYLLVLNNHIILCLQNYHMNSFVDTTAKRRRHHLSLHPSSDVSPPYSRNILGEAEQIVLTNHYIVHIRWLPIWFAGSKPEPNWMLFMQFSQSGDLSFILFTTRNTPVFQELSLHELARSLYLAFFDSWNFSVRLFLIMKLLYVVQRRLRKSSPIKAMQCLRCMG